VSEHDHFGDIPYLDQINPDVDEELLKAGVRAVELVERIRGNLQIVNLESDEEMALVTFAYFLGRIAQVTRASLTLLRHRQGAEATLLLREQHEFTVALLYYQMHRRQAALFCASADFERLALAAKYDPLTLNAQARAKNKKSALKLKERIKSSACRFRELEDVCPGSAMGCMSRKKHSHAWKRIGFADMLRALMKAWYPPTLARLDVHVSPKAATAQTIAIADHLHFVRSTFVSHQKHALPSALPANVFLREGKVLEIQYGEKRPNELAYHIVGCLAPVIFDTIRFAHLDALMPIAEAWHAGLEDIKSRLGIADSNPAVTAVRDVGTKS